MTTEPARRFKFITGVVLCALLVSGLCAAFPVRPSNSAAGVGVIPHCVDSQLAVTGTEAPGGSLHAGLVIRYRNIGATACSLTGYSVVVGLNLDTGKTRVAGHIPDGYLGGWMGHKNGKVKPLPLVLLRARKGVASSMVEWADGGTAQQPGCIVLTSLWVNTPDGPRPFVLKEWMLVCGYFDATPFVPGATGSSR